MPSTSFVQSCIKPLWKSLQIEGLLLSTSYGLHLSSRSSSFVDDLGFEMLVGSVIIIGGQGRNLVITSRTSRFMSVDGRKLLVPLPSSTFSLIGLCPCLEKQSSFSGF